MKMKRLLVLSLAAVLAVCIGAYAAGIYSPDVSVWDGKSVSEPWYSIYTYKDSAGNQKESKFYCIAKASELAWLAQEVNKGNDFKDQYFGLMRDIDLNGHEWTPIGYAPIGYELIGEGFYRPVVVLANCKPFSGIFCGNYFTISGLKIDRSNADTAQGLFGIISGCDTMFDVQCLTVKGSVTGKHFVGGVVGYSYNNAFSVTKSYVDVKGEYAVGGVIGASARGCTGNKWNINLVSMGNVSGGNAVGGICGIVRDSTEGSPSGLIRCVSGSSVKGTQMAESTAAGQKVELNGDNVGGIVGEAINAYGDFGRCVFEGAVSGDANVGGLVGLVSDDITIHDCVVNAVVTSNQYGGALAGVSCLTSSKFYNNAWNSAKTPVSIDKIYNSEGSHYGNSNTSFEDVASIKPQVVFLTANANSVAAGEKIFIQAHAYPTGADTNGAFVWNFGSGVTDNIIDVDYGTDNSSITVTALGDVGQSFDIKLSKDSLISDYSLRYVIDYSVHSVYSPFMPANSEIECITPTDIKTLDSLPDYVSERAKTLLAEDKGVIILSSADVSVEIEGDSALQNEVDPSGTMVMIPLFRASVSSGKTALICFSTALNDYLGRKFGDLTVIKELPDGSIRTLAYQGTPSAIQDGQFTITDTDGAVIDLESKPVENRSYYISLAVKDGGTYDFDGAENGEVFDPAGIAVKNTSGGAGGGAESSGGGGGSGCNAGFGGLLLFAVISIGWRRKK